jgi:hypothetical protein
MQPFDYRIAVQDPLQMALAGYQQGQQFQQQRVQGERETQLYDMEMQQYQANQAKLQQEQARAQAMQADMAAYAEKMRTGRGTVDDVIEITGKYPELGEQSQSVFELKTAAQKNETKKQLARLGSALKFSPKEQAPRIISETMAALQASGDVDTLKGIEAIKGIADMDPSYALSAIMIEANNVMEPEEFEAFGKLIMPEAPELPAEVRAFEAFAQLAGILPGTPEYAKAAEEAMSGGGQTININPELSAGFKAMDQSFGPIAVEWQTGGGSDALSQLVKIEDVISRVDSGENISGGVTGFAPDLLRAIVDPNAQDAKETVEDVVQRNLRVILGAQFTAAEGERLVARAFNPRLSPEINRKRLQRLFTQMRLAAEQKQEMVNWFRTKGTLVGYDGRQPSMNDFYTAIEGTGGGNQTADQATLDQIISQLPE